MRIPRIYLPRPLASGDDVALDEAAARHVIRVLRLKPGAPLMVFNGEGEEYRATVTAADPRSAQLRIEAPVERTSESPLQVTLAQGVSRGERMDYTLQKAVELGVAHIVPLITERCQVRLEGERRERRRRHWLGVIAGAAEQSGRTCLPGLAQIESLPDWLAEVAGPDDDYRLVLDPTAAQGLSDLGRTARTVTLLIGPEGGLSGAEVAGARRAGFEPIRLGPRVLRTETAAVAALAAIQSLWGDLG